MNSMKDRLMRSSVSTSRLRVCWTWASVNELMMNVLRS